MVVVSRSRTGEELGAPRGSGRGRGAAEPAVAGQRRRGARAKDGATEPAVAEGAAPPSLPRPGRSRGRRKASMRGAKPRCTGGGTQRLAGEARGGGGVVFGGEACLGGQRWPAGRHAADRTEASSSRRKKGGRGRRKGRRKKMSSEIDRWAPQK